MLEVRFEKFKRLLLRYVLCGPWLLMAVFVGFIVHHLTPLDWNAAIVAFTAVLLAWYSIETRFLRVQSFDATRLSIHPGLTLRYKRGPIGWTFLLSNEGKGAALNPRIISLNIDDFPLVFNVNGVNAINAGDSIDVSWYYHGFENSECVFNDFGDRQIAVRIEFQSAFDLDTILTTEELIGGPPISSITKTSWF